MDNTYRKKCFWGDCDLDKNWLNENLTIELIGKMWELERGYVYNALKSVFTDDSNMLNLAKEIIFNYLENPYEKGIMDMYMNDLVSCAKRNNLQWYQWEFLRRIFTSVNAMVYSDFCRKKAEEIVLSFNDDADSLSLRKFSIAACRGDYKKCEMIMNSVDTEKMNSVWGTQGNAMQEYLDTIIGKVNVEDEFGKYLFGKRIIISGPAAREQKLEALHMDEVGIKFTYRGRAYLSEMEKEFIPNISYYNFASSEIIFSEKQDFVDDLNYIVLKGTNNNNKSLRMDAKVRIAHMLSFGCGFGYPNMVQIALYDLFHYNSKIYIENIDCYYSKKIYSPGYLAIEYNDLRKFKKQEGTSYAMQDIIGNWRLLKTWYEEGKFLCDERLKNVLALSEDEYAKGLEEYHRLDLHGLF